MKMMIVVLFLIIGAINLQAASFIEVVFHHENNFFLSWLIEWSQETNSWLKWYEDIYSVRSLIILGLSITLIILAFVLIQYIYQLITLDKTSKLTLMGIFEMFFWKSITNNIIFKIVILTFVSLVILKPVPVILMKPVMKNNEVQCWTPDINTHNADVSLSNVSSITDKETLHIPLLLALPLNLIERMIYGFDLERTDSTNGVYTYNIEKNPGTGGIVLVLEDKETNYKGEEFLYKGAFKKIKTLNELSTTDYENCKIGASFTKLIGTNAETLGDAGAPIRKIVQLFSLQETIANTAINNQETKLKGELEDKSFDNFKRKLKIINDEVEKELFQNVSSKVLKPELYNNNISSINEKLTSLTQIINEIRGTPAPDGDVNGDVGNSLLSNIMLENIFLKSSEDIYENVYAINLTREELSKKCKPKYDSTIPTFYCDTNVTDADNPANLLIGILRAESNLRKQATDDFNLEIPKDYFINGINVSNYLHGKNIEGLGYFNAINEFKVNNYDKMITIPASQTTTATYSSVDKTLLTNFTSEFMEKTILKDNLKVGGIKLIDGQAFNTSKLKEKGLKLIVKDDSQNNFDKLEIDIDNDTDSNLNNTLSELVVQNIFWQILKRKIITKIKTPEDLFNITKVKELLQNINSYIELPTSNTNTLPFKINIKKGDLTNKLANEDFTKELNRFLNLTKLIYQINYLNNIFVETNNFLKSKLKTYKIIQEEIKKGSKYRDKQNWLTGEITFGGFALNPYVSQVTKLTEKVSFFKKLSTGLTKNTFIQEVSTVKSIENETKVKVSPTENFGYPGDPLLKDKILFIGDVPYNSFPELLDNNKAYLYSQENAKYNVSAHKYIKGNTKIQSEYTQDNGLFYNPNIFNLSGRETGLYGNLYKDVFELNENYGFNSMYCDDKNDILSCIYSLTSIKSGGSKDTINSIKFHTVDGNRITEAYYLAEPYEVIIPEEEKDKLGLNIKTINSIRKKVGDELDAYLNIVNSVDTLGKGYNLLIRDLMLSMVKYLEVDTSSKSLKWKTTLSSKETKELDNYRNKVVSAADSTLFTEISDCVPTNNQTGTQIKTFLDSLDNNIKSRCTNLAGIAFNVEEAISSGIKDISEVVNIEYENYDVYKDYDSRIRDMKTKLDILKQDLTTFKANLNEPILFFKNLANVLVLNSETSIMRSNSDYTIGSQEMGAMISRYVSYLYNQGLNDDYERVKKLEFDLLTNLELNRTFDLVTFLGFDKIYTQTIQFEDKNTEFTVTNFVLSLLIFILKFITLFVFVFNILLILFFALAATFIGWTLILILPIYAYFSQVVIDNYRAFMEQNGGSKLIRIIDTVNAWLFKLVIASTIVYVIFSVVLIIINVAIYNFGLNLLITTYLEDIIENGKLSMMTELTVFMYILFEVIIVLFLTTILLSILKNWLKKTAVQETFDMAGMVAGSIKDVTTQVKLK